MINQELAGKIFGFALILLIPIGLSLQRTRKMKQIRKDLDSHLLSQGYKKTGAGGWMAPPITYELKGLGLKMFNSYKKRALTKRQAQAVNMIYREMDFGETPFELTRRYGKTYRFEKHKLQNPILSERFVVQGELNPELVSTLESFLLKNMDIVMLDDFDGFEYDDHKIRMIFYWQESPEIEKALNWLKQMKS